MWGLMFPVNCQSLVTIAPSVLEKIGENDFRLGGSSAPGCGGRTPNQVRMIGLDEIYNWYEPRGRTRNRFDATAPNADSLVSNTTEKN